MKKLICHLVIYSLLFIVVGKNSTAQASDKQNEETAITVESNVAEFFGRYVSEIAHITEDMPNAKNLITDRGFNKCFRSYATWPNESKPATVPFRRFVFEQCIDRMHVFLKPEYLPDDRFARKHFLAIKSSPECPSDRVYLRYRINQKNIMIVMDEMNTHVFCTNVQKHINAQNASDVRAEITVNLKEMLNFDFDSLKPRITFDVGSDDIGGIIEVEYNNPRYEEFPYKSHWNGLFSSKEFYINIPYFPAAARFPVLDEWFNGLDPSVVVIDLNKADRFEPELTWTLPLRSMYDSQTIRIILPWQYHNVFTKQKSKNFKIQISELEEGKVFDIKVTPLPNQNEVIEDVEMFIEGNKFKPYIGDLHLKLLGNKSQ